MEDLLRIRLNSANELEKFPAKKYAKNFIYGAQKHLRTDDQLRKGGKSKKISLVEEENKNKKYLPKPSFL